jgi:hypothetical protein
MIPAVTPQQVMDHYAYMVTVNRIISRMNSWLKDQRELRDRGLPKRYPSKEGY